MTDTSTGLSAEQIAELKRRKAERDQRSAAFIDQRNAALETDAPDDAAYDIKKSQELGIPREAIGGAREEYRAEDMLAGMEKMRAQSPRTSEWMRTPENYAVAKDEADVWASVEKEFGNFRKDLDTVAGYFKQTADSLKPEDMYFAPAVDMAKGAIRNPRRVATEVGDMGRSLASAAPMSIGSISSGLGTFLESAITTYDKNIISNIPVVNRAVSEAKAWEAQFMARHPDFARAVAPYAGPSQILKTYGAQGKAIQKAWEPETMGFEDKVAQGLGQLVVQVGMAMATGGSSAGLTASAAQAQAAASAGISTTMFMAMGVDQQAEMMRAAGVDPNDKLLELASGAAITGSSEMLRLDRVMKILPPEVRNRVAKSVVGRVAGQAFEEGIQEGVENALHNFIATSYDPNATILGGVGEAAAVGGTVGGVFQALIELAMPGKARAPSAQEINNILKDVASTQPSAGEKLISGVMEKFAKANLGKRSPEKAADLVNKIVEGTGAETVVIDLDGLAQSLTTAGMDVRETLTQLGVDPDAIGELGQLMGTAEIPMGRLASASAQLLSAQIVPHMRLATEDLTPFQKTELEGIAELAKRYTDELKEDIARDASKLGAFVDVQEQIYTALKGSGINLTEEQYRHNANVEATRVAYVAMKRGQDVRETFAELGPKIMGRDGAAQGGAALQQKADEMRTRLDEAWTSSRTMQPKEAARVWKNAVEEFKTFAASASAQELIAASDMLLDRELLLKMEAPKLEKMMKTLGLPAPGPMMALNEMRDAITAALRSANAGQADSSDPLAQSLPKSMSGIAKMTTEQMGEWYVDNVQETRQDFPDGTSRITLRFKTDDAAAAQDSVVILQVENGKVSADLVLRGTMGGPALQLPPKPDVMTPELEAERAAIAAEIRTRSDTAMQMFRRAIVAMRHWAALEQPSAMTFSGSSVDHEKLYNFFLSRMEFEGYTNHVVEAIIGGITTRTANQSNQPETSGETFVGPMVKFVVLKDGEDLSNYAETEASKGRAGRDLDGNPTQGYRAVTTREIGPSGSSVRGLERGGSRAGEADPGGDGTDAENLTQPRRGGYDPKTREMSLSGISDASTFLHENSHWFLATLEELAPTEQWAADDLAEINSWYQSIRETPKMTEIRLRYSVIPEGEAFRIIYDPPADMIGNRPPPMKLERVASMEEAQAKIEWRERQEAWAETTEEYFMTGESPTPRLKQILRDFKNWLVQVYRGMLPGERANLTPEIKSMMDRIMAVDVEVDAASAEVFRDARKMADEMLGKGIITPRQHKLVGDRLDKAREEVKEELLARVMQEKLDAAQASRATERSIILGNLARAFDKSPVGRAFNWLAYGEWKGDLPGAPATKGEAESARSDEMVFQEGVPLGQSMPTPDNYVPVEEVASVDGSFAFARGQLFATNRDLKVAMQDRVQRAADENDADLFDEDYLVRMTERDARSALKGNANAVGWYDEKVRKAIAALTLLHPELETDAEARFAFTWALAVTSNGLKVDKNFELAEKVYRAWNKSANSNAARRMPTNVGIGTAKKAINKSLGLYNTLVKQHGVDVVLKFMTDRQTVKQVMAFTGENVSGENLTTEVFGAAALGPKIGNGFFMNLYGEFGQLTMDRWLMRTWGRWTATLVTDYSSQARDSRKKLVGLLKMLSPADKRAFEKIIRRPIKLREIDEVGLAIQRASQNPDLRAEMNKIGLFMDGQPQQVTDILGPAPKGDPRESIGAEIRKRGNALAKYLDGQKEQPSGPPERKKIRTVFARALENMKKDYPALTMADLQALLWYPEKRLYDTAKAKEGEETEGYEDDEAPDYANAARNLVVSKGVAEAKVRDAYARIDADVQAARRAGRVEPGSDGRSGDGGAAGVQGVSSQNETLPQDPASEGLGQGGGLYQLRSAFYSALTRFIENSSTVRAPAAQWKSMITNASGLKAEEIEWSGLMDWLEMSVPGEGSNSDGIVSRDEILEYLNKRGIKMQLVIAGDRASAVPGRPDSDNVFDDLVFDGGETWDDPEAWESDVEYYLSDVFPPDLENYTDSIRWKTFLEEAYESYLEDNLEEIREALNLPRGNISLSTAIADNETYSTVFEYIDDTYDHGQRDDWIMDNNTNYYEDAANEFAREAYVNNDPMMIYEAETNDGQYITIFGNDSTGYNIFYGQSGAWRNYRDRVNGREIYSYNEAEIAAQQYAIDNDLLDLPENGEQDVDDSVEEAPAIEGDQPGSGLLAGAQLQPSTKWSSYQAPGPKSNYREFKILLPEIPGTFVHTTHFSDKNIVAFMRVSDRQLAADKSDSSKKENTFYVDESQSDWHQQGRQRIYDTPADRERAEGMKAKLLADITTADMARSTARLAATEALEVALPELDGATMGTHGRLQGILTNTFKETARDGTMVYDEAMIRRNLENFFDKIEPGSASERILGIMDLFKAERAKEVALQNLEKKLKKVQDALANPVPNVPYKGDAWINLSIKQALIAAIAEGKTHLAWADSGVLKKRWSDRYSELYENTYDKKWVKATAKVAGVQPVHFENAFDQGQGYWIVPITEQVKDIITDPDKGLSLFQTKAPIFYSALSRFIENSKAAKAPASQWKGMITNAPGIKVEEVEMSGVMDWLDLQQGPVTREALAAFVAANGVTVEEVVKGGGVLPNAEEYQRQLLPLIERRDEVIRQIDAEYRDPDGPDLNLISRLEDEGRSLQNQISELENFSGLDGQSDDTKWSSWTLPGGENYTELLLRLPTEIKAKQNWRVRRGDNMSAGLFSTEAEAQAWIDQNGTTPGFLRIEREPDSQIETGYRSSHWGELNVLAHVRFKERIGPNGERVLALEEIQSDWHQAGRERGYKGTKEKIAAAENRVAQARAALLKAGEQAGADASLIDALIDTLGSFRVIRQAPITSGTTEYQEMAAAVRELHFAKNGVLDAPFKNNAWVDLVLKRMIRYAAENKFDSVAWIPGNIQNGKVVEADDNRSDFYDKIVPNAANKLGKKYGARVGKAPMDVADPSSSYAVGAYDADGNLDMEFEDRAEAERYVAAELAGGNVLTLKDLGNLEFWTLPITPELREAALSEGFPLFQPRKFNPPGHGAIAPPADIPPVRLDLKLVKDLYGEEAVRKLPAAVRQRSSTSSNVTDIIQQIEAVRKVLSVKRKGPQTLTQFIMQRQVKQQDGSKRNRQWGIKGAAGELRAMGLERLINEKSGMTLDAMRELAEEAGFIRAETGGARATEYGDLDATPNDLLDALAREAKGENVVRIGEEADNKELDDAKTWASWLEQNGVDIYEASPKKLRASVDAMLRDTDESLVSPDKAAEMFGFANGEELLKALAEVGNRDAFLNKLADQKMVEEFGDMMSDGTLQAEAAEAARLDIAHRQTEIELEALARAVGQQASANYAKSLARDIIAMRTVKEIAAYERDLNNERQFGKQALRLVEKGDYPAALKAKQRQLVSMQLYIEGKKASEKIEKRRQDLLKYYTSEGRRDKIAGDYLEKIEDILDRFELRVSKQGPSVQRERMSAAKYVADMDAAGRQDEVAPEARLLAELNDKMVWRNMTSAEVDHLVGTIQNLAHLGRTKDSLLRAAEKRKFRAVIDALTDRMNLTGKLPGVTRERSPTKTTTEVLVDTLREGHSWLMRPEHQARSLDGGELGPVWEAIFRPISEAGDVESRMMREATQLYREAWDKFTGSERNAMTQRSISVPELPGIGKRFTKLDLISVALNWGVIYNREVLMEGYGWNAEQVEAALFRVLTDKDWDFVESIWEISGMYKAEAFQVEKDMTGVEPKSVEGIPFTLPSGRKINGKYYHIQYDASQPGKMSRRQAKDNDAEALSSHRKSRTKAMTKNGGLIERKGSGGRKVKLGLAVFEKALAETVHDIAFRRAVYDVGRIIADDQFADTYQEVAGMEAYRQLNVWLKDVAMPPMEVLDPIVKAFAHVRRNVPLAVMGYKIGTALIQPTGLLAAMPLVGHRRVLVAVAKSFANPDRSMYGAWKQVASMSEFMRDRVAGYERDVRETTTAMTKGGALDVMRRNAFTFITGMDIAVSVPTWMAAYGKAMDGKVKGIDAGNQEDAVAFADSIIRRTQTAGKTQDLSRFQRGGEFQKQISMIFGYFNNLYSLSAQQTLDMRRGNLSKAQYAWHMTVLFVAIPLFAELLAGRLIPDEDDEDEATIEGNIATTLISNFSGMFPGIRDAVGLNLKPEFGYRMSPTGKFIEDIGKTLGLPAQLLLDEERELTEADIKRAVNTAGALTGLPAAQINITGGFIVDTLQGEEDPMEDPMDAASEAFVRNTR